MISTLVTWPWTSDFQNLPKACLLSSPSNQTTLQRQCCYLSLVFHCLVAGSKNKLQWGPEKNRKHNNEIAIVLGAVSIWMCRLTIIGISMWKITWPHDHLVFNMGIPTAGKTVFILKHGPGPLHRKSWLRKQMDGQHKLKTQWKKH